MAENPSPRLRKRLTPHGNSLALVIDKPILELLGIGKDTELEISTDGTRLVIEPINPAARRQRIAKIMEEIDATHSRTLKRLAE